jgi:hypothetical protein
MRANNVLTPASKELVSCLFHTGLELGRPKDHQSAMSHQRCADETDEWLPHAQKVRLSKEITTLMMTYHPSSLSTLVCST